MKGDDATASLSLERAVQLAGGTFNLSSTQGQAGVADVFKIGERASVTRSSGPSQVDGLDSISTCCVNLNTSYLYKIPPKICNFWPDRCVLVLSALATV